MDSKNVLKKFKKYLCENEEKIVVKETRRGAIMFVNETIFEKYKIDWYHHQAPKVIVQEAEYLFNGDLKNLMKSPWWDNDKELAKEYIKLFRDVANIVAVGEGPKFSRNYVACNSKCCYSWIQIINKKMIVVCRSTDMAKGYLWDVEMAKYLAALYKCRDLEMIFLHQHLYLKNLLDFNFIARRKK